MIIPLKFHYFYTTFPYFQSGHFSDRTFFVTPAVTRFSSLLSVINIDSLICLSPGDTSFVHFIALFGKAATALTRKSRAIHKKEEREFPTPLSSYYIVKYLFPISRSIFVETNFVFMPFLID